MDRVYNAVVRAYRGLANWMIVVVLLLFALIFVLYLFPRRADSFRARGGPDHVQMQLAYEKDAWVTYVESWGKHTGSIESAVHEYRMHLLRLDVVFPVIHVVLLMSTIAWLTKELDKRPSKWVLILFLLPVVGGIFDLAENYMHISMLQGAKSVGDLRNIPADSIRLSFIFTVSKYSLLVLALSVAILSSLYRGLYRGSFKMERQTKFPVDIDVRNPHNPELKAIFESRADLSDEQKDKIKKGLQQKLESLEAELTAETDAKNRDELKEKIREIKEVLGQFSEIMRLMDIHVTQLDTVIAREKTIIGERRKQAAKEYEVALLEKRNRKIENELEKEIEEAQEDAAKDVDEERELTPSQREYKDQLASEERRPIGLAFSGGGIRSATFNLGLLQGLAKYGILPWVDYLTSVSGGGLIAACMTTLLAKRGKGEKGGYCDFNTQWDYFPFNPELKAFDGKGVAHTGESTDDVGPPLERGPNKQLEYLRDKGNFLIPRMGWVTRDVLRAIGAFLVRIGYTVCVFLLVLLAFSAFHYGVTAALTPSIKENVPLNAPDLAALIPTDKFLGTLAAGIAFSLLMGWVLTLFYRKDSTRKKKLIPWKSPVEDVTLETYLTINYVRLFALVCLLGLLVLTLGLWIGRFQMWSQSTSDLRDFYWAWGLLFIPFTFVAGRFVLKHTKDDSWLQRGMPEQLRIDTLAIHTLAGLFVWIMALWIAWLRFPAFQENHSGSQIFWIWLPTIFTLGSLIGLAFFRNLPLQRPVYVKKGTRYSLGWFERILVNLILAKDDDRKAPTATEKEEFKSFIWSNSEFRGTFWTLQGLVLYGLLGFLVLAFLALPHYFLVGKDADSDIVAPLATAIVSAGWAALLSYVNRKADFKAPNLIAKMIALPSGVRNYVLGLLVIVLNLSIIFLIESRIDNLSVRDAYVVGIIALVLLWVLGRFFDFNYLTPHYFVRDRMAEVFMRTEVVTETGQVEVARDDRQKRLYEMTPEGCSAPYHIVLTTLNLPGTWFLELKDRKSQPFILSKYYCGSDITGYVKTRKYRDGLAKYSRAIALSGAAVSPGLGYHTFFAQAFMTTLLNIRLGLWMISPEQYKLNVLSKYARPHQRERRVFWPAYLGDEAFGRISERRHLINLTDGEHTGDGYGLCPLFQRRCKVIIVGDASGDPAGLGRGLFSVIRQVKADWGIEVDINIDGTRPAEHDREKNVAEPSQRHFAVGKITYPATVDAEGKELPQTDGWLIYFKAAVTKDDPGPILSYWETHKMDFPVPPTADQFFDEEQWDLQRWLGEFTIEHTLLEVKRYCEEKIHKIKEKRRKSGKGYAGIRKLKIQKRLVEEWLDHKAIDYDILSNNPKVLEWLMSTLYDISKGLDDKNEK